MPVKLRRSKRTNRITGAAVAAYRAGDSSALMFALEMGPWETSPLDADDGPAPAWLKGDRERRDWEQAQELRRALMRELVALR